MTTHQTSRISITLALAADRSQRAWLTMHVRPRDDGDVRAQVDLDEALRNPLDASQSEKTIIRSEIMGGVVTAKRHAKRGCSIELIQLGGESGAGGTLTSVPSIAYAIAANLAVLQGLGVEDLRAAPRGGYGWALESVEVAVLE